MDAGPDLVQLVVLLTDYCLQHTHTKRRERGEGERGERGEERERERERRGGGRDNIVNTTGENK